MVSVCHLTGLSRRIAPRDADVEFGWNPSVLEAGMCRRAMSCALGSAVEQLQTLPGENWAILVDQKMAERSSIECKLLPA